jgi:hypothetical protein
MVELRVLFLLGLIAVALASMATVVAVFALGGWLGHTARPWLVRHRRAVFNRLRGGHSTTLPPLPPAAKAAPLVRAREAAWPPRC